MPSLLISQPTRQLSTEAPPFAPPGSLVCQPAPRVDPFVPPGVHALPQAPATSEPFSPLASPAFQRVAVDSSGIAPPLLPMPRSTADTTGIGPHWPYALWVPTPKRQSGAGDQLPGNSASLPLDALGKSARVTASLLDSGLSFSELCERLRGPTCLANTSKLSHPASDFLFRIRRTGVPVLQSSLPWTLEQRDAAVARGPHQSAKAHSSFLRDEVCSMAEAGQWLVLPYSCVRNLPGLHLAPMGLIPQRERRGRPIVDYTFAGVNQDTVCLAPDSMQFGRTAERILQALHRADTRHGPVYLAKADISDAFMQVWIATHCISVLGALFPTLADEEPLIGFPLILPMGWVERQCPHTGSNPLPMLHPKCYHTPLNRQNTKVSHHLESGAKGLSNVPSTWWTCTWMTSYSSLKVPKQYAMQPAAHCLSVSMPSSDPWNQLITHIERSPIP